VRTPGGLYTYPDVMVVCGGVELSRDDRLDTVTNPTAIVEVLSPSTAAYDRGEKFRLYEAFPTLREYLLIDQSARLVEHYGRADVTGAWSRHEYSAPTSTVELPSLGVRMAVADIHAGVEFESMQAD
jgi:Uma2 family endonuclease